MLPSASPPVVRGRKVDGSMFAKTEKLNDMRGLCVNCGGAFLDSAVNRCCSAPMQKRGVTLAEAYAILAAKAQRGFSDFAVDG